MWHYGKGRTIDGRHIPITTTIIIIFPSLELCWDLVIDTIQINKALIIALVNRVQPQGSIWGNMVQLISNMFYLSRNQNSISMCITCTNDEVIVFSIIWSVPICQCLVNFLRCLHAWCARRNMTWKNCWRNTGGIFLTVGQHWAVYNIRSQLTIHHCVNPPSTGKFFQ